MKLTIWKSASSAVSTKEEFDKKLGALRIATGRPDRFVSRCACAVHEKPFSVVYERTDPARPFIITGIYKDGEGGESGGETCGTSAAPRTRALPASEIDSTGWRCPHCDAEGLNIACNACGTTVCGGRTRTYHGMAPVFACRPSCGARGTLEDAEVIKGIDAGKPSGAFRSAALRTPGQSFLPGPDTKRLGSTK